MNVVPECVLDEVEEGDYIADLGCGRNAASSLEFSEKGGTVYAVDSNKPRIASTEELNGVHVQPKAAFAVTCIKSDAVKWLENIVAGTSDDCPAQFRVVFCKGLLHMLPSEDAAHFLKLLAQVVAPGGILYLTSWFVRPTPDHCKGMAVTNYSAEDILPYFEGWKALQAVNGFKRRSTPHFGRSTVRMSYVAEVLLRKPLA